MREHDQHQHRWNGADFKVHSLLFEFTGITSMLAAGLISAPELMLIAGVILLAWVLFRGQMTSKRRLRAEVAANELTLAKQNIDSNRSMPLSDAPLETQRWQIAMFELHRELKADLDTRTAVVSSLLRQVDERIAHLEKISR